MDIPHQDDIQPRPRRDSSNQDDIQQRCVPNVLILVYLYVLRIRLSKINETLEFFSHALDMWCFLFVLAKRGTIDSLGIDLRYLLQLLAALAYHDGYYLLMSCRKIIIDIFSGTSIGLLLFQTWTYPPRHIVSGYSRHGDHKYDRKYEYEPPIPDTQPPYRPK
jgi:hypothetical protein